MSLEERSRTRRRLDSFEMERKEQCVLYYYIGFGLVDLG